MDSGIISSDARLDATVAVVTAVFQVLFLCRTAYGAVSHRSHIRNLAERCMKAATRAFAQTPHSDGERLVLEKVSELRLQIARLFIKYICALLCMTLLIVLWRAMRKAPLFVSPATTLAAAVAFWIFALLDAFPAILTARRLNAMYIIMTGYWAATLSPWHVQPTNASQLSLLYLAFARMPAVGIATTPALVAVCSLFPLLVLGLRVGTGEMPEVRPFAIEFCAFIGTVVASTSVQQVLTYRIERSLQYKKMATDFNATSSLLHLMCDSVIELDADLRMVEHSPSLAALLLRGRPGATLAGTDFTDLLANAAEAGRAVELLRGLEDCPRDGVNAQAFQTHLMDSDTNKFRTEVFQVMYHTPEGHARHLIGLRDVTDQGSLSGSRAVESFSILPRSSTPMSLACSSIGSKASGPSGPNVNAQENANAGKFLSLLVDVDLQVVHTSSSFAYLGRHPAELFSTTGMQLLDRALAEVSFETPISLSALEFRLGSHYEVVSATVQLVQNPAVRSYLILVCAPSGLMPPKGSSEFSSVADLETGKHRELLVGAEYQFGDYVCVRL